MDPLRTNALPRVDIADFIKSDRGVRSYEDLQGDAVNVYEAISTASFLTITGSPSLGAERTLTLTNDFDATDGGPNDLYTLGLSDTTVVPGAYGGVPKLLTIAVDAKGRLTSVVETAFDTDDVPEGGVNLYYTDARSRAAISATSPLGYNSGTGVMSITGILSEANGGTGFSSYVAGDLLYAANATTLARLGVGLNNYVLTSNGSLPGWSAATGTGNVVRATQPQFTNTIGVGVAASASGAGVSFPATQSASTDPNTLDDYEEGTWTPVVSPGSGVITTYTASGSYTKIGRFVHASAIVNISNNGTGAGQINISLPFTAAAVGEWTGFGRENAATGLGISATIVSSATSAQCFYSKDNSYPGGTGTKLVVTMMYHV